MLHWAYDYLSMLVLKLNHVSKRGHWRCSNNYKSVNFLLMLQLELFSVSCEISFRCMLQGPIDDKASLDPVTAPIHYLIQCWPRSMLPYGITRPQWGNSIIQLQSNVLGSIMISDWFLKVSYQMFYLKCINIFFINLNKNISKMCSEHAHLHHTHFWGHESV